MFLVWCVSSGIYMCQQREQIGIIGKQPTFCYLSGFFCHTADSSIAACVCAWHALPGRIVNTIFTAALMLINVTWIAPFVELSVNTPPGLCVLPDFIVFDDLQVPGYEKLNLKKCVPKYERVSSGQTLFFTYQSGLKIVLTNSQ